jgi:hypothetical protein
MMPQYATTDAIPAGANMADERAFGLGCPWSKSKGPAAGKTRPGGRLEPPAEASCQRISIHLPDVEYEGRDPRSAVAIAPQQPLASAAYQRTDTTRPDDKVAMGQIASDQRRRRYRPSSAAGLRHCSLNEVHQAK